MIPLFAPEAVREMDRRAIAGGVDARALMERAAGALARTAVATAGRGYGLRVAVLCGKGNNGGDGLAAARLLMARHGAAPVVWLAAAEEELSADAATQLRRLRAEGGRVEPSLAGALTGAELALDCLLGTGSAGAPRGAVAQAITTLGQSDLPVLACDVPSGVDAATGAVADVAVRARVTVTIGAEKVGLRLWPARGHCGRIQRADVGILRAEDRAGTALLEHSDVAALLPAPPADSEKRTRGVVLVVAGSRGMSGAAVLAARGALAAGAGLVTVAADEDVLARVAAVLPEALTLTLPREARHAAKLVSERASESDAVVFGPGRGVDDEAVALARRVVADCARPLVLDADGLNAFRHDGDALAEHASPLLVLTPHGRELERLTGDGAVWADRLARLPELAARWRAVVVAKGPGSLTAAADGRAWVNGTGGPELATGGTGDVLAGMLGAALARAPRPEVVAAVVALHGLAGELAADRARAATIGPLDLAGAVPAALRRTREAA